MSGEADLAEAARIGCEARKRTRVLTDGEIAVLREAARYARESDAWDAADAAPALGVPRAERGEAWNEACEARSRPGSDGWGRKSTWGWPRGRPTASAREARSERARARRLRRRVPLDPGLRVRPVAHLALRPPGGPAVSCYDGVLAGAGPYQVHTFATGEAWLGSPGTDCMGAATEAARRVPLAAARTAGERGASATEPPAGGPLP